jgi:hypothetical protein
MLEIHLFVYVYVYVCVCVCHFGCLVSWPHHSNGILHICPGLWHENTIMTQK